MDLHCNSKICLCSADWDLLINGTTEFIVKLHLEDRRTQLGLLTRFSWNYAYFGWTGKRRTDLQHKFLWISCEFRELDAFILFWYWSSAYLRILAFHWSRQIRSKERLLYWFICFWLLWINVSVVWWLLLSLSFST